MRRLLAAWAALGVMAGCAWRSEEGEPVPVQLALQFPSKTSATILDDVSVYAFDGISCVDLLEQYRLGSVTVKPIAQVTAELCTYYFGDVSFEVEVGTHTFFAVGTGPSETGELIDYYTGCVEQSIGGTDAELPLTMSYSADVGFVPNSCTSVGTYCNRQCPE